jgi:hypothetical protein
VLAANSGDVFFWELNMNKLTSLGAFAFAAVLAGLAIMGFSTPAQAYPEVQIFLEVDRQQLYGGEKFTATASSEGATCTWTLEWNGDARESDATFEFATTYTAPDVTEITRIPLSGTCVYTAPSARGAATWQRTIMITVLPPSSAVAPPVGSNLPNAGGPDRIILAGGAVLLMAGASAVFVARRRAEEAEMSTYAA